MRKLLLRTMLMALVLGGPIPAMAAVDISIGISLPPPIVFPAPPAVIPMPETNGVYVAPDLAVDLFFWNGWWWRPWEGGWYRARYYDRGWAYYDHVPRFYFDVDPGWRGYYRAHAWAGHPWEYQRIPHRRLQQHWQSWQTDRHWERHGTWGVQGYLPRPEHQRQELSRQRQQQYQQRPEVQHHQQQRQALAQDPQGQHQGHPQVQQPRQHPQEKLQRQQRPPQVEQTRQQPQERGQRHQGQEQRPQAHQAQYSQPHGKENQKEGR
jgi:hypothetical protein